MRAEEIKDAESLQAWLESLPQETEAERETARRWAVTIAHRAAMRELLSIFVAELELAKSTKYFGSSAIICALFVALRYDLLMKWRRTNALSGEDYRIFRDHLKSFSAYFVEAAAQRLSHKPKDVTPYISNPLRATATMNSLLSLHEAYAMHGAATFRPKSFFKSIDCLETDSVRFGQAIRSDVTAFYNGEGISETPIAIADYPEKETFKRLVGELLVLNAGWRFWVGWYENALYGRPQDYDLLTKIALIDSADWDKGADHVNALIAQIRLEHIAETRPLGEDEIDLGPDGLWRRTGKSDIDRDILQDAVESVRDEIATLRAKLQGPQGNMFTALVSDLDLLEQRIARHPDRPLRLHDVFIRVQGHVARNLQSGELPDDDCVRDLSSVLGIAALDMCNACDKTKAVVQKRVAVRFDEADEQTRDDLKLIAEGAAQISDADLASEFIEDAEVIADEAIPLSEKTSTLYRLQTRLARIVSKDGKNLVDALCLIGAVGSGLGVLTWITTTLLRFIIGP